VEFDYWWLIVCPVFFALGWIAARIDIDHLVRESRNLPRSYFKGLNFLLNEQPDKAIDAFIEVVKVSPETIDLHFALGSLFRRRGETERAIRMHRNLLDRADLAPEQRDQAVAALGEDFLKAGLLDRAEECYAGLRSGPYRPEALRRLLEIYQLLKDWPKAIETAGILSTESGEAKQREIAHYHCEVAQAAQAASDPLAARQALARALEVSRDCVRASIMLGDLAAREGDQAAAIDAWQRIEHQDPAYLALVARRLLDAWRATGRVTEGLARLRHYLADYPSIDILDVTFQAALEEEGAEAAHRLVREELRRNPTLLGLDHLLEAQLLGADAPQRQELEMMRGLVHAHTQKLSRYKCQNCGFRARQFYWQCPACAGWESYLPRRVEEIELA
jgi:lipopolysaccharide biosynthesis regulator YciM